MTSLWRATAQSTVPRQRNAYQAVVNPGEYGPNEWAFQPVRDVGHTKAFSPADAQSDNYRSLNEGYHRVEAGMFRQTVGTEPIYGHVDYPLNPLDQEQTNAKAYEIQKETRILDTRNSMRTMVNIPSQYPNYRGRPVYDNFPGRNSVRR